ncbi:hypothetical protein OSTOST_01508 [Ostertagia ostertagi]
MAEQILIKLMQRNITKEEERKWEHLGLHPDENGLIRCQGRLQAKYLPRDVIEPMPCLQEMERQAILLPNIPIIANSQTQPTKPFSYIGIDLAGPFTIVDSDHIAKKFIDKHSEQQQKTITKSVAMASLSKRRSVWIMLSVVCVDKKEEYGQ